MTSYAAFFLESMHLPVVMLGDRDGFDRFFVLLFQWRHCYRGYRKVWGSADMKEPQGLRIAHIGTGVCFHVEPMLCWFSAFLPEIPIVVMTPAKQTSTPKFGRP